MITVYFESNGHAVQVATFESEYFYMVCLPALEEEAKAHGMVVTETVS